MRNLLLRFAVICTLAVVFANVAPAQAAPATGPFATKATVEVKSDDKVIPLKREEQIAFMFMNAIGSLEDDCTRDAAEPCTLEALVRGPKQKKPDWPMGKLKHDPVKTDPNYTYVIKLGGEGGLKAQIWANPKKPGFGGFYSRIGGFGSGTWYNAKGAATDKDTKLTETGINGDLFQTQ